MNIRRINIYPKLISVNTFTGPHKTPLCITHTFSNLQREIDVSSWGKQFIIWLGLSVIIPAKISSKFENLYLFSPDQPHRGLSHKIYYFQYSINKALFTLFSIKSGKNLVQCTRKDCTFHWLEINICLWFNANPQAAN